MGGVKSEGSSSVFASYDITEPYLNTTWGLGVDWSDTEIVSGPMESLEVKGDFYDWHLGVKRPVFVTENSVVTGGLRSDIKHSKNHIAAMKVHDIKTDTVSGFVDWLYLFGRGYFYNMFEATHAVHINQGQEHFWHYNYLAQGQVGFLNTAKDMDITADACGVNVSVAVSVGVQTNKAPEPAGEADEKDVNVNTGDGKDVFKSDAKSDKSSFAAGVAASGSGLGAGLSGVYSDVHNTAKAKITGGTTTANTLSLTAKDASDILTVAVGGAGASNAAAVVNVNYNKIANNVLSGIKQTKLTGKKAFAANATLMII